tara:strand:- start:758 stop:1003 length:246 start_codon:yes stop_codon:yes gene_type:complete
MSRSREEKHTKFTELCEKRVSKATHYLNSIGNLSNRSHYHFTDDQISEMEKHLRATLNEMLLKFKSKTGEQKFKFSSSIDK